ncbi:hypothetical protein TanjilG_25337 [Lupinus angustifolius]|uniref:Anaphase-promoting complex subunit 4 WD40 domain-containing protein n=1 Tax=Lupinus angustifolius TaxID=3871 RepID=A0A4P1RUZ2_LUPAN|nr:PREDICTED: WD repeat-containing protein 44-like [Lupinus angustifolius]OIW18894.1 hypothetical protein TanjilG_25337 [Lupinus angustifolius]
MDHRRMLTMNWDGLGDDDDDDRFFETNSRLSTAVAVDLAASSSDDDDDDDDDDNFDDPRMSFVSAVSSLPSRKLRDRATVAPAMAMTPDYEIWMAAPASITERRKRLLHGMGLDDDNEFLKASSVQLSHAISKKFEGHNNNKNNPHVVASSVALQKKTEHKTENKTEHKTEHRTEDKTEHSSVRFVLVRSRSEGDIDLFSMEKTRKEDFIGKVSKQRLTRMASEIAVPRARMTDGSKVVVKDGRNEAGETKQHGRKVSSTAVADSAVGAFVLIKNLDTGKEFIVNEYGENGTWNKFSDLQTGKKLTKEEFEKTVGHSRVVNELMRRTNVAARNEGYSGKLSSSSYISRSLRLSKRRGAGLLKNIKGVASGFIGDREREARVQMMQQQQHVLENKAAKNQWVRVRQSGKSYKELSALHLCQEFQAHDGCIWTMEFSLDGRYLASAGEDKVIHVWEVQECEVMSLRPEEGNLTPIHPSLLASSDRNGHAEAPPLFSEKKKRSKFGSKRGNTVPEYVHVPETVFSLSEKPYCSFQGHLNDILDLSWSKSQLLLSSSMDKIVRLWDLDTKTCLKMFAHNDYVTCIQFNPIDDDYFISGSLDAKVRIWNIPERHVVDWTDTHEMVTAVSYSPDGQCALVGTHKGSCRTYSTEDCKLSQTGTIEIRHKKKSQLRKVTGFQFAPGNPSEVLVTSADSRIRILNGSEVVHKFRGFRNANSQIAASFSPDGRYIISASEDSQVYVWKHEEHRNAGSGKGRNVLVTRSHEHFQCKDVSIAIPWPNTIKGDPPPVPVHHSKRHSKRHSPFFGDDTAVGTNSKRILPPLPKKTNATESALNSPTGDPAAISRSESGLGDSFTNSKRVIPTLSKKTNNCATESVPTSIEEDPKALSRTESGLGDSFSNNNRLSPNISKKSNHHSTESTSTHIEDEDLDATPRTDSGIGDSFSRSASARSADSPSISFSGTPLSASWSSSYSSFDSTNGSGTIHPSAWGLVIVTAGFGGEIRCYQNFGLPRRMGRQANLFGSPT